jgi:hypothetical protein
MVAYRGTQLVTGSTSSLSGVRDGIWQPNDNTLQRHKYKENIRSSKMNTLAAGGGLPFRSRARDDYFKDVMSSQFLMYGFFHLLWHICEDIQPKGFICCLPGIPGLLLEFEQIELDVIFATWEKT